MCFNSAAAAHKTRTTLSRDQSWSQIAAKPSSYLFITTPAPAGGKTLQWRVLSGEGHCTSAMARTVCILRAILSCYSCYGALAQLGERLICIQEVRSSILLGSTKSGSVAQVVRAHA